jgi:glucosamine kinase
MSELYLGVDGGGSGCRAVLALGDGRVVGRGAGGSANPFAVGVEAAWQSVVQAARAALAQAGLEPGALANIHACLGLAGIDRPGVREAFLAAAPPLASLRLESDVHVALVGAFGREEGALLIAGTGSIAYAVTAGGVRHRVGGWGFTVGDEGGGAWLGRAAVRAALHAFDGRGPATTLQEVVFARWGPDVAALSGRVRAATPRDYAAFAPDALAAAEGGDAVAARLRDEAVAQLALLTRALERRLPAGKVAFSVAGSLAKALFGLLKPQLPLRLREGYREPRAPAEEGALWLALHRR